MDRKGHPGLMPANIDAGLRGRIEALTKSVDGLKSGLRFSKGKTEWRPGAISPRNFKGIDISVPGIKAGDSVSIGTTHKLPDGVFLTGAVHEDGKVRVTAINMTDSDMDIDSGTLRVDVRND